MGLKCWGFYSNVGDTTLKAKAVSGQSVFVKKDEEKFYGEFYLGFFDFGRIFIEQRMRRNYNSLESFAGFHDIQRCWLSG